MRSRESCGKGGCSLVGKAGGYNQILWKEHGPCHSTAQGKVPKDELLRHPAVPKIPASIQGPTSFKMPDRHCSEGSGCCVCWWHEERSLFMATTTEPFRNRGCWQLCHLPRMAFKVRVTLGIDVQPTDGPRAWKLGHGELHQARHGTHQFCPDHAGEMQLRTHSSAEAGKWDLAENSERQRRFRYSAGSVPHLHPHRCTHSSYSRVYTSTHCLMHIFVLCNRLMDCFINCLFHKAIINIFFSPLILLYHEFNDYTVGHWT